MYTVLCTGYYDGIHTQPQYVQISDVMRVSAHKYFAEIFVNEQSNVLALVIYTVKQQKQLSVIRLYISVINMRLYI